MTDGVDIPITTPGGPEGAAVLRALAQAMKDVGIETERAGNKADAAKSAFNFNQLAEAASRLHEGFTRFAGSVSDLASEQARLDANSTRLGLNFDEAADAAGRFTDETEAMGAATRLAEAGIRLSQEQLDALTRVAARFAQNTGTTTASAIDTLTNGLITGSARGLRPFGGELVRVAGDSHTAEQRLAALTAQAGHTAQATDDAASSMARFVDRIDDTKRAMATAFTQGIADALTLTTAVDESGNKFEILTEDITAAGRAMGTAVVGIGNGIATVAGGVATAVSAMLSGLVAGAEAASVVYNRVANRQFSGLGAAAVAAARASIADSSITRGLMDFTAARADAANRIADRGLAGDEGATWGAREQRMADEAIARGNAITERAERAAGVHTGDRPGGGGGSHRDEHAKSAKAAQMAMDRADDAARALQRRVDRDFYADLVRQAREYENAIHGAAVQWGEQVTHADEVARITARVAGLAGEQADAEIRLQRARMAQQRAEGGVAARAETADLRDPATRVARVEEMAQQHQLQRARAYLDQRYQLQRTYTDRMEELHGQEFNSTQALAEGVTGAFEGMGKAFGDHLQALVTGKETLGEALQGMLSDTLASIAQQATVKGAMELAEGISALAGIVTAPKAPGHFAAAAAYFGVAALAGLGAAATAPSAASATAPAPAAPRESAARVSGSKGSASGGEGVVYNISFGGPMYGTGGVRQAARQMVGAINRGGIQGGVQLLPGVLQGAGAGT